MIFLVLILPFFILFATVLPVSYLSVFTLFEHTIL
jgi:hypothetical protein